MRRSPARVALGLVSLAGLTTVLVMALGGASGHAPADAPAPVALPPSSPLAAAPPTADVAAIQRAEALQRVEAVRQHGSLRGTALDGDWGHWAGDTLQPGLGLRRRFDHLLTAQGELPLDDLRAWIGANVAREHGASGAQQVLAIWDAYLALLRSTEPEAFDPDNPASVQAALARRSAQRRAALGLAWAQAFYDEEERDTVDFIARRAAAKAGVAHDGPDTANAMNSLNQAATALLSAPTPNLDPAQARAREAQRIATFGVEGAERLATENAAWADWESRLAAARLRLQALADDPQLSAPQRQQAQQAELARSFEGSERLRAQALLLP